MIIGDREFTDPLQSALKVLVDEADGEDKDIRERQIRVWRKLKLYWDGFQRLWYSEVAHDWRTDNSQGSDMYSSYYDKPINVFRSYIESIIAALSVSIPSIKCYPDDADNVLDLDTARAGDKIAELIYKQNNAILHWIHALFILQTEGLVAAYRYTKADKKFGTYDEDVYEDQEEEQEYVACPNCATELVEDNYCPQCMDEVEPIPSMRTITNRVKTKTIQKPKSRQCFDVFGGLFVKVPSYAKKQEDCPYLMWTYETHYSYARARYPDANIHEGGAATGRDFYERWGRTSIQYLGDEPDNMVTVRNLWVRPEFYHILDKDKLDIVKKKFPDGVKIVMIDDKLCEAEKEILDDCWTLTHNPLSDYLNHEPSGLLLVNVQEITNDLISLVLQTIEAGISQTFADPKVLDFKAYEKVESTPGLIFPARARAGQTMSQSFFETKTATLSREIEPFMQRVQELGQLTSGALPSLFGGQAPGSSRTAAEYSMSRAQALQRLQTTWKMLTIWWQEIFSKMIPAYVDNVMQDERLVEKDESGNFVNIFIRKAELQGKIGRIELEASENLPVSFAQKKDVVMEILKELNPDSPLSVALMAPENIGLLTDAVGIHEFRIPNQDDIDKQHEEIQQLIQSAPIPNEDPMIPMPMLPSINIEPDVDNHEVQAETCRRWLVSAAGRSVRVENLDGYQNVLLHLKAHLLMIQPPPAPMPLGQQPEASGPQGPNLEGANGLNEQYGPNQPGIAVQ